MSIYEVLDRIDQISKEWHNGLSRDGLIQVWRKSYQYRNIPYELAMLQYFTLDQGIFGKGMNQLGRHVVLEYPQELRKLVNYIVGLGVDGFLYRDTLHAGQSDWTLEMMMQEMHEEAQDCINQLYSELLPKDEIKEILIECLVKYHRKSKENIISMLLSEIL